MRKTLKIFMFIFSSFIFMTACTSNEEAIETEPYTLLRVEEVAENNTSALHYIIEPATERASVLFTMDDEYIYYDLEEYETTEDEIRFAYDGNAIILSEISESRYEDVHGNIYGLSYLEESVNE